MAGWNDAVIEQFLEGRERVADMFDLGDLVLLDTVGAKTGATRTSPVAGFEVDGRLTVAASKAGAPDNPAWFHNLRAEPHVRVRRWVNGELTDFAATATVLHGEERDRVWAEIVQRAPGFGEYQTKTDRIIPVVVLEREG